MYCAPNVTWVIKAKKMRCVGLVACVGNRNAHRSLVGKCEGK